MQIHFQVKMGEKISSDDGERHCCKQKIPRKNFVLYLKGQLPGSPAADWGVVRCDDRWAGWPVS